MEGLKRGSNAIEEKCGNRENQRSHDILNRVA
ncbi:hypothetical protein MARHY0935 [Marinobacter nauticus ATCC 49840]|nr:hypothetical protein MARHY0935 [Marinobacter nauticus ATCC 49840]